MNSSHSIYIEPSIWHGVRNKTNIPHTRSDLYPLFIVGRGLRIGTMTLKRQTTRGFIKASRF